MAMAGVTEGNYAVEFNDEISCIDVLYDLASLLMDLWRRKLPRQASIVWTRYLGGKNPLEYQ